MLILNIHKVKTLFEHARYIKKYLYSATLSTDANIRSIVKWNPILGGFQIIKKKKLKEEDEEESHIANIVVSRNCRRLRYALKTFYWSPKYQFPLTLQRTLFFCIRHATFFSWCICALFSVHKNRLHKIKFDKISSIDENSHEIYVEDVAIHKNALKNQIRRLLFSHFTLIFFCSLISPLFIHSFAYTLSASSREAWIAVLYYPTNYWSVFMYWRWTRNNPHSWLAASFSFVFSRSTSDLHRLTAKYHFLISSSWLQLLYFAACSMRANRTTWQVQKVRILDCTLCRGLKVAVLSIFMVK